MTTPRKKVATFVRNLAGFTGHAALYRLTPPLERHAHVVVSATVAMFSGPETYIFAANAKGKVTKWGELPGSYRSGLDHAKALRGAGYEVHYKKARGA